MADREQLARTIRTLADAIGPATLEGFAGAAWDLGCLAERAGKPIEETRARDVAELVGDYPELQPLTSDPWLPIEECGELERGRYLVQLRSGAQIVALWSGDSEGWVLRQRDLDEFDSPRDITHVHRMGPIRGPGEG